MDVRQVLQFARAVLFAVANRTTTTFDDQAVGFLDALIASDELLAWFTGMIGSGIPDGAMLSLDDSLALKLPDPTKIAEFLAFAKMILELLKPFLSEKG